MGAATSSNLTHAVVLYHEAGATQRARELQDERESKAAKRRRRRRTRTYRNNPAYIPRELRVRSILETLTAPLKWPSVRPDWLMGEKGKPLELDCYNATLRIAFEADGMQHRKYIRHFHGSGRLTFQEQKQRDLLKDALCREHKVALVRVPPRERLGDHQLVLWIMQALQRAGFQPDAPPPP